jgi:hypothetical protein
MPKTMTAGEIIAALSKLDPNRPVLLATSEWYMNIAEINGDPDSHAATIEVTDDFNTTQW